MMSDSLKAVTFLLSAYNDNRPDREAFMKIAAQSLEDFSSATLVALCHPKTGIVATSKFMPSIAEMREFCLTKANAKRYEPKALPPEKRMTKEQREAGLRKLEALSAELALREAERKGAA